MPSRSMAVTTTAATPAPARSARSSSTVRPLPCSHPRMATSVRPVGIEPVVDPDRHLAREGRRPACGPGPGRRGPACRAPPGRPLRPAAHRRRPRSAPRRPICTGTVDGGGDGQHRRPVDRLPGPGRVEVDHVQPAGPGGREPPGQGHRVAVVGLPVEVALGQAHRPAVADVDGRVQVHHAAVMATSGRRPAARTKLARMPRPTEPDFSGWNWVPHTGPRSAEAVTGPP